jgi:hypothetical protein
MSNQQGYEAGVVSGRDKERIRIIRDLRQLREYYANKGLFEQALVVDLCISEAKLPRRMRKKTGMSVK